MVIGRIHLVRQGMEAAVMIDNDHMPQFVWEEVWKNKPPWVNKDGQ